MAIDDENDLSNIFLEEEDLMDSVFDSYMSNETQARQPKSANKRSKPDLKCVVCGDHAFGYNFDAVSCESCKAFFRRNALRPPGKLKCRGSGHCEVTVEKRKRCKKCRLDKCLRMGMRKEWILSEEEKRKKKSKIEDNRRYKTVNGNAPARRRRSLKHLKDEKDSSYEDELHVSTCDDLPLMTSTDWSKIHQIQFAYTDSISLNKVVGVPLFPATQPINNAQDLIRMPTYLASVRLLTFFKKIPEFNLFDPEDRVVLVKYNLLAVVFMHSVLIYEPVGDSYHEHDTEDPIFQGQDWAKIFGDEIYQEMVGVAKSLIEICQYDRVIMKMFLLLILCIKGFCAYEISLEPSLRNHAVVFDTQNMYLESLYKYCLHRFGFKTTVNLFSRATIQLLAIQRLAVHFKDFVHNHIDASDLSPLMQSVLQLSDSDVIA